MRIEISYTAVGNGFCIYLTRKDIEAEVWREIEEIELRRRFGKAIVLSWSSADHNKDEEVFKWCESEGKVFAGAVVVGIFDLKEGRLEEIIWRMSEEEAEKIKGVLEQDKKFNMLLRELRRISSNEEYAYELFKSK